MIKQLLIITGSILLSSSICLALTKCERDITRAERKVTSAESACERSQDRVKLLENSKADTLEAMRARENINNNYDSTGSVGCVIAEAFGECDARRRRRSFVELLNLREASFNRRIKTQQDRANRDCAKLVTANERLAQVRSTCTM